MKTNTKTNTNATVNKYICRTEAEWQKYRKGYIGGSDAAAALGMSPFRSAYNLWAEKTGKLEGFAGNGVTELGTILEPEVATKWCDATGKRVRNDNATMVNSLYPFACANIDRRVVGENALLECKTTANWDVIAECRECEKSGTFPRHYYAQCLHYLAVTGYDKAYLAVWDRARGEFFKFELERDQSEIDALMQAEREFWAHVTSDTEPPVDGSKDAAETLGLLHAEAEPGKEIDLGGMQGAIYNYCTARDDKADADEKMREAENAIKQAMGDAETGWCGTTKITWKNTARGRRFAVKEGE